MLTIGAKISNWRLRYREKCSNTYTRQLLRLVKMLAKKPLPSIANGILKAHLGLTYDCQCSCEYCCSGLYTRKKQQELSDQEIKKIIDDVEAIGSLCTVVTFFGGEALLRDSVHLFIRYAAEKGLFTEIETNGILLTLENVKKLKKSGLHHIFVRIEDLTPAIHDGISHVEGCFRRAISGIKHCIAEGLSCSLSTIATKEKIYNNKLKEIVDFGRQLGVTSVRILYPVPAGKWLNKSASLLTLEEKAKVQELLCPDFVYLESSYVCNRKQKKICPARQKKFFYISCYGDIQPCPFVPLVFGNIRQKRLKDVLRKMWAGPYFKGADNEDCLMSNREIHNKCLADTFHPVQAS